MPKFFILFPVDKEKKEYFISYPDNEESCQKLMNFWMAHYNVDKKDVKIVELFMPETEFKKLKPKATRIWTNDMEKLLAENKKYKPTVKSLTKLSAKKLAENPVFFNSNRANKSAEELFNKERHKKETRGSQKKK